MNETKITARQMEAMLALFFFGSSVVTGGSGAAKQDTWLCIIIAAALSIPLLRIYSGVIDLYPGRNYYDNIITACGKIPGKILVLILSLYSFFTGALIIRQEAEFIHIVNLTETPLLAIFVSIIGCSIFILKSRLYVLARVSKFIMPIIFVFIGITVVLSVKDWNFSHMKPFLNSGFSDMVSGSLLVLAVPFGESSVCASMFGQLDSREKSYPVLLKGLLLGSAVILAANLRNLLILGYSAGFYAFPSYAAVSVIALGEFFTRIEVLIGINLVLAGIVKICVMTFCMCSGLAKVFGLKDYEPIVFPCALAIFTLAQYTEGSAQDMYILYQYLPWLDLPVQILVPLAALIAGTVRSRLTPKKKAKPKQPVGPAGTVRAE